MSALLRMLTVVTIVALSTIAYADIVDERALGCSEREVGDSCGANRVCEASTCTSHSYDGYRRVETSYPCKRCVETVLSSSQLGIGIAAALVLMAGGSWLAVRQHRRET